MTPTNLKAVERLIERLRVWPARPHKEMTISIAHMMAEAADALTVANARVAELETELARRDANETRNCLNWGPCSRNDGRMAEPGEMIARTLANDTPA